MALCQRVLSPGDPSSADCFDLSHLVRSCPIPPIVRQIDALHQLIVQLIGCSSEDGCVASHSVLIKERQLEAPWQLERFHLFLLHAMLPSLISRVSDRVSNFSRATQLCADILTVEPAPDSNASLSELIVWTHDHSGDSVFHVVLKS